MGPLVNAQTPNPASSVHKAIQNHTNTIFDSLVAIRRDFHKHPETGGHEKRTAEFIEGYLKGLGLEVKSGIGGYGVVGILKGNPNGKKIAWRADIDAMPWDTPETGEFASTTDGVRHICGHDVHTTIALGMANVLVNQKEQLNGTVYLIFQPSEENYHGAQDMIADGLFDLISPDEMYAAHISPMPAGLVASKPGYLYADYKQINISFEQNQEQDSIIAFTKDLLLKLQNVAPDGKFWDTQNLMDPNIGIGNPNTIFKDYTTISNNIKVEEEDKSITVIAFVSASNKKRMDSIPELLRQQIAKSKYADDLIDIIYASKIFTYSPERGNIDNDGPLTTEAIETISGIYGASSAIPLYGAIPDGRGDDFAYFQQEIPGTYFLLGGSNFEKGIIAMPHSDSFKVDENCIKTGVNYFSSLILERVNN